MYIKIFLSIILIAIAFTAPLSAQMSQKVRAAKKLIGGVINQSSWPETTSGKRYGIYSIQTSNPYSIEPVILSNEMDANGGGAIYNNVYHFVWFMNDATYGFFGSYYEIDITSGKQIKYQSLEKADLVASATAYDETTGLTYGCFSNSDMTGWNFGYVDYSSLKKTILNNNSKYFVALGISSKGEIYGIGSDGILYRINKTNGQTTVIGSTGVNIQSTDGNVFAQSGAIDPASDVFYWAAYDASEHSRLYNVDIATGKAELLGDIPDNSQFVSLCVPAPEAKEDAPDEAHNLNVEFEGGSTDGFISFTIPNETYGGKELTSPVDYYVTLDGDTINNGTATTGSTIRQALSTNNGEHKFGVVLHNEAGYSPTVTKTKWIGYDIPNAIDKVNFTISGRTANINWNPSTGAVHNGYLGNLTYNVMRLPDSVVVAQATAATNITDELPESEARAWRYEVTPCNGDITGAPTYSNTNVYGSAITPPYTEDFSTANSFDLLTIVDANADGNTWQWYSGVGYATYRANDNVADDWLITPLLKLEKGKVYHLSFRAENAINGYPELLEVGYGKGKEPSTYQKIIEPTKIDGEKWIYFNQDIKPNENGDYAVGFHVVSKPANSYRLFLDNIKIESSSVVEAPDSVTSLKAIADAEGGMRVTLNFNAPTRSIAGNELDTVDSIFIERNDTIIGKLAKTNAGEACQFVDNNVKMTGNNTYKVTASNASGKGTARSVTVFVGTDIPQAPEVKLSDKNNSVLVSWNAVTRGKNGGFADPTNITYSLYEFDLYGYSQQLANGLTGTELNVPMKTQEGSQGVLQVALTANNKVGESEYGYSNMLIVGKPFDLPYYESFKNGGIDNGFAVAQGSLSNARFNTTTEFSQDNDGGCLAWVATSAEQWSYVNLGKINLTGTANPKLAFYSYSVPKQDMTLDVIAQLPDGTQQIVSTISLANVETEGWASHWVDLNSFKDKNYVLIILRAKNNVDKQSLIGIDNIRIIDAIDTDIAVHKPSTGKLTAGAPGKVYVKVTNQGLQSIQNYSVTLFANEDVVEEKDIDQSLASLADTTIEFTFTPSVTAANDTKLYAEVFCEYDENESNDISDTLIVSISKSTLPPPTAVTATINGSQAIISWTEPQQVAAEAVTEDFESYEPWTITDFGDWTLYNGNDVGTAGLWGNQVNFTNEYGKFAYIIFNVENLGLSLEKNPSMSPHSGHQMAMAVTLQQKGNTVPQNDGWLISPALPGLAQTVSFYAATATNSFGAENIEVLYSTTGNNPEDFIHIADYDVTNVPTGVGEWGDAISFDIPEGSKYFAIRYRSQDKYNLYLDDISFVKYGEGGNTGKLLGYRIYHDGKLIGTVSAAQTSFTDDITSAGSYTYAVTAVYENGESQLSASATVTGITSVWLGKPAKSIVNINGYRIPASKQINQLPNGVYIIDGKKVIIK